jgi:hypothetical protein
MLNSQRDHSPAKNAYFDTLRYRHLDFTLPLAGESSLSEEVRVGKPSPAATASDPPAARESEERGTQSDLRIVLDGWSHLAGSVVTSRTFVWKKHLPALS